MSDNKRVKVGTGITYGSAYMAGYRVYAKLIEAFGASPVNAHMPPAELMHKLQGVLPDIEVRTVFTAGLNDARQSKNNGDGYSDDEIMRYVDEKPLPEFKTDDARVWIERVDDYIVYIKADDYKTVKRGGKNVVASVTTLKEAQKHFDEAVASIKAEEVERLKDELAKMDAKHADIAYIADAIGTTIRNARLHTTSAALPVNQLDAIEVAWKRLMETIDSAGK